MRAPLALVLGVAAAVALASCGGGEDAQLLPGGTASEITENLDTVKQLASEGECVGAEDAAEQVSAQIEALGGIDEKLKQALQRGAVRLNEVVATCEEATTEALAPSSVPTEGREPPGQEKKGKEKKEKPEKEEPTPPSAPTEATPPTPPPTTPAPPPSESGGTGAPGGVSPGNAVGEED